MKLTARMLKRIINEELARSQRARRSRLTEGTRGNPVKITPEYINRIIIPSHDDNLKLNFYLSRSTDENAFLKYKNCLVKRKEIIFNDYLIDWTKPVVLVEGVFDAMAIRMNAIPLFGKTISNTLKKRIVENQVESIYICLDQDARKQAFETAEYFMGNGIDVYFVDLQDKDPSEIGFQKIISYIDDTCRLTAERLMEEKILCML